MFALNMNDLGGGGVPALPPGVRGVGSGRGWRKRAPISGGQLRVTLLCPGAVLWSREEQVQGRMWELPAATTERKPNGQSLTNEAPSCFNKK